MLLPSFVAAKAPRFHQVTGFNPFDCGKKKNRNDDDHLDLVDASSPHRPTRRSSSSSSSRQCTNVLFAATAVVLLFAAMPQKAQAQTLAADPTEQPTPNPTPAIPSWLVQHNSTIADFNKSSGDEITLEYLIGKGREPRVTLFQSGCENPLFDSDGITLGTEPATTDIADDPNHSKYQVYLDVIKNATVLGDQYANGILSFCVLLELLSGGTPIKSDKTEVAITLNFNNTFEIKDVNLTQIYVGSDSIATTVLEYVEACACYDHQDGECNPNPVITGGRDDDKVKVCIKSTSPEMEIDYLDRLVLEGNDPAELLDIVTTGENWDSATASLVKAPLWNGVYVAGVVPDSYYSYSQDVIAKVTGVVYLKLAGSSRRRIAVELDVDADAGHDGSEVIADAASGAARALQSAVDVEQQQESAFAVNFALQKTSELEQLGDADVNGATATGAGAWMSAGLIPSAAVVIGSTSAAVASIMMW